MPVPTGKRYDPDVNVRGGNTKLVVGRDRRLQEIFPVLGGTHTNCAGGQTPWDTWITCEEIFNYGSIETNVTPGTGVPHGYSLRGRRRTPTAPVPPQPILDAGRFSHEAVAWYGDALYETEDRGDACLYRFTPERQPKEAGDLATFGGKLEALVVRGRPNFDMDSAQPGRDLPDRVGHRSTSPTRSPTPSATRRRPRARRSSTAPRASGPPTRASTSTARAAATPASGSCGSCARAAVTAATLKLIFESTTAEDLEAPDNLVVVPATGDVFLQEDGPTATQYVRGVTPKGLIYDFARTIVNPTEFCGGCFSPDGQTFFLSQQGDRLVGDQTPT